MMKKILIADEVPDFFIRELQSLSFEVQYFPELNETTFHEELKDIFGLVVRSKTSVTRAFMEQLPALKLIMRPGSGIENIDQKFAAQAGIAIITSPEGNRDAVGEHVLGMLLSLMHCIVPAYAGIKEGNWEREANRGLELKGKTLGIIGYGNTGSRVARKLQGFEMNVLAYDLKDGVQDEFAHEVSLKTLKEKADIVSFHVPLSEQNHHLVNEAFLDEFAKPIFLINTSRGKVVKTDALLNALKEGKLKGACLDVLENEKLESYSDQERKQLDELLSLKNVLLTPHIAGWSKESLDRNYTVLIDKLKNWLE